MPGAVGRHSSMKRRLLHRNWAFAPDREAPNTTQPGTLATSISCRNCPNKVRTVRDPLVRVVDSGVLPAQRLPNARKATTIVSLAEKTPMDSWHASCFGDAVGLKTPTHLNRWKRKQPDRYGDSAQNLHMIPFMTPRGRGFLSHSATIPSWPRPWLGVPLDEAPKHTLASGGLGELHRWRSCTVQLLGPQTASTAGAATQ